MRGRAPHRNVAAYRHVNVHVRRPRFVVGVIADFALERLTNQVRGVAWCDLSSRPVPNK